MRYRFKYLPPFILLLTASLLFGSILSCKKNVPGPKGDRGAPGGQGTLVLTDTLYTVSQWTLSNNSWQSELKSDMISQSVLSSGGLDAYVKIGDYWWSLPYGEGDLFMEVTFKTGSAAFRYFKIHGGPPENPGLTNFRVVVMKPA